MERGDIIKCFDCHKEFELTKKTFWIDTKAEYITCPYCDKTHDVNDYHIRDNSISLIKLYLEEKGFDINNPKKEVERLLKVINSKGI